MRHDRTVTLCIVAVIALMLLALGIVLVFTVKSRNALSRAAVREKELNRCLRESNDKLQQLNATLGENNRVKDAYIVQYFDLCSHFVGRLEQFSNSVAGVARTKGLAGVEQLLAKTDSNVELKRFYASFDSTFLKLFPNFIDRLNDLLRPECRVAIGRDGSLSNELRTFALIRLGITDSDRIATFLRRSVTTIYNYRVKLRNAAIADRDTFEDRVREI